MKFNKYVLLAIVLCVTSLPVQGMRYIINTAGKIIGMALAIGPSLGSGGQKAIGSFFETKSEYSKIFQDGIEKEYPQLSPNEAGNMHNIIKECEVNLQDIDIRVDEQNSLAGPMATIERGGKSYIFVQKDALGGINGHEISSLSMQKWYAPLFESKEALAVCLRHEVGHLVRGDARLGKNAIEEFSAAGMVLALTCLIQRKMPVPISAGQAILYGALYIGLGYVNSEKIIPTIRGLQQRVHENAAEKFAFQHTKNAQELRKYANACEKIGVIHEKCNVQSWAEFLHRPSFEQYYYSLSGKNRLNVLKAMNFFDEHPPMLERSLWARQAADKLELQSDRAS